MDVRNQLNRWAAPDQVQWHFSGIRDRWIKRALAAIKMHEPKYAKSKPLFSVAQVGPYSNDNDPTVEENQQSKDDIETGINVERQQQQDEAVRRDSYTRYLPILGVDRSFHPDLDSAVRTVIESLEQEQIDKQIEDEQKEGLESNASN